MITAERQKKINEWLEGHCSSCINNADAGTEFVDCQEQCEVAINTGIACIHYDRICLEEENGS